LIIYSMYLSSGRNKISVLASLQYCSGTPLLRFERLFAC
jgi:hypothetical protein